MLTETILRIPFSVIGRCSLVATSHWLQGARINVSKAALGMILQNHRWLPVSIVSIKITALGSESGYARRIFKSSKEQAKTLTSFSSTKKEKTISACAESTYLLF
jgi:hypothetical protein